MAYSCVYSLYMAATDLSPCFLMPLLAVIWVNVTSMANFWMSHIKYSPSAGGELSVICFSYKLHFEDISTFSCVGPSWTCVCVFHAPYLTYLLLLFLSHLDFFLSLVVDQCPHLQSFFWEVIFNGGVLFVFLVLIFDDVVNLIILPV